MIRSLLKSLALGSVCALAWCAIALNAHADPVSLTNAIPASLGFTTSPGVQQLFQAATTNIIPVIGLFDPTNLIVDGNILESGGKLGGVGNILYRTGSSTFSPCVGIGAVYEPVSHDWIVQLPSVGFKQAFSLNVGSFAIPFVAYESTAAGLNLRDTSQLQNVTEAGIFTYLHTGIGTFYAGYGKLIATHETSANEIDFAFQAHFKVFGVEW